MIENIINITLDSRVLAAIIGGVTGFLASYVIELLKRRKRKINLRVALIEEIRGIELQLKRWMESMDDNWDGSSFPHHLEYRVFNSRMDDIGMLSRTEVRLLVQYYTALSSFEVACQNSDMADKNSIVRIKYNINNIRNRLMKELEKRSDSLLEYYIRQLFRMRDLNKNHRKE